MTRTGGRPRAWIAALPAHLLVASVILRALLTVEAGPARPPVLAVLGTWLALYLAEPALHRRWNRAFPLYAVVQAGLAFYLMAVMDLDPFDFYALLFAVLSMQVMQRLPPTHGPVWIGVFTLLLTMPLIGRNGLAEGAGFALIYLAANAFFGFYALANRRAEEAHHRSRDLARELDSANGQLRIASSQLEQLAVARARHRLARELHDSVTQTVFSMTLAAQSALLLLDREPARVSSQLDHLTRLAENALSQMRVLISELRPEAIGEGGLAIDAVFGLIGGLVGGAIFGARRATACLSR